MKAKVNRTSYDTAVEWTAVTISDERMNALKLKALKERRSVATLLDMILEKAGIPLVSDGEFARLTKQTQDGLIPAK